MTASQIAQLTASGAGIRTTRITALLATMFLGLTLTAAAQSAPEQTPSRTQQLSAERDSKAQSVSAPRRSLIERGLHWYDNNHPLRFGAVHFSGGSFPAGAGFGYGVGISELAMGSPIVDPTQPNRIDGSMFAARSMRGYQRLSARMDVRNLAGRAFDATLRWQDFELTQEDFYGLGTATSTDHRTNYRLDGTEIGAAITWRATQRLSIGGELSHLTPNVGSGTDRRYASVESRFGEADAPGLVNLPAFVRSDVSLTSDWRDSATHPRRGGQYKATVSQFSGVNDTAFDFRRFDVSAQQVLPLPNRYRRLELRAAAAFTENSDDRMVPFIYQPTLGGVSTLRGYSESRFRDRNAVWASVEYQWEAWWALDAAFFIDAGQVAAHREEFAFKDFDVSYGVGFRLHGNEHFIARLDLAYGSEGFHPILGFKYGF